MTKDFSRIEVITGVARRRRFTADQKVAIVAETMQPGLSISPAPGFAGTPLKAYRSRLEV